MNVIDEGGFGCVMGPPPLNCQHAKPTNPSWVSKLQLAKNAEYEMKQINKIKKLCKKIPKCEDYVNTDVKMCNPVLPKSTAKTKTKCSLLEPGLTGNTSYSIHNHHLKTKKASASSSFLTKKKSFKLINMPNLGSNLHRYMIHQADFRNPQTFVHINRSLIELYQNFIRVLNAQDFYHNDIKTLNIMVDAHRKFRLIDFGIANKIVFSHQFVFNRPYMYILLSDYFLDKIDTLKRQGPLHYPAVKQLVLNYLDLIKLSQDSNYTYTKEILELLFPDATGGDINPMLLECFVQTAMRYKSKKNWEDIYLHNLDITGMALMYADILCAMSMKKQLPTKLQHGIVALTRKYVLQCYEPIDSDTFVADLNKLNMLVL